MFGSQWTNSIIEAGKTERQYWRDLLGYQAFLLPGLARYSGKIQADCRRCGLGSPPTSPNDDHFDCGLRQVLQRCHRVRSLCHPGLLVCCHSSSLRTALSESGNSGVANAGMISKIYFPRPVLPASSVITSLADFLISAAIMALLMAWYGYLPSANIIFLPVFIDGFCDRVWRRTLDRSFDGQIRDFRPSFHLSSVGPLHFTSRAFTAASPWAMAPSLFSESMVGVIDELPLGNSQWRTHHLFAGFVLSLGGLTALVGTGMVFSPETERCLMDIIDQSALVEHGERKERFGGYGATSNVPSAGLL